MLPSDPFMLLSVVNMKLRDGSSSLSALCDDMDENETDIKEKLSSIGYSYDEEKNAFIAE